MAVGPAEPGERIRAVEIQTSELAKDINELEGQVDRQFTVLDRKIDRVHERLDQRLPLWASVVGSVLTSACSVLATLLVLKGGA